MGHRHFSPNSAKKITHMISMSFHQSLIDHILSTNSPVGMIIDGSVSGPNKHFVAILFEVIENNTPTCHFYRLVQLGVQEDANAIVEAILAAFKEDGIYEKLQKTLVSFTSDGVSGLFHYIFHLYSQVIQTSQVENVISYFKYRLT